MNDQFLNPNEYFKTTEPENIKEAFENYPPVRNETNYIPLSEIKNGLKLIEKLKKEIINGDANLEYVNGQLIRTTYVLNLKVYFSGSTMPIKELIRVKNNVEDTPDPHNLFDKVRTDNYISEKCSPEKMKFETRSEIMRTLREELLISDPKILSVEPGDENTPILGELPSEDTKFGIGISDKSTYRFIKTKSVVYNYNVYLEQGVSMINSSYIMCNLPNHFIFYTPEYEKHKFKRITVWNLSNSDDEMNTLISLMDKETIQQMVFYYNGTPEQNYDLFTPNA